MSAAPPAGYRTGANRWERGTLWLQHVDPPPAVEGPGRRSLRTRTRLRPYREGPGRGRAVSISSTFWTSTRRRSGPWRSWCAIRPGLGRRGHTSTFFLLIRPQRRLLRAADRRRHMRNGGARPERAAERARRGAARTWARGRPALGGGGPGGAGRARRARSMLPARRGAPRPGAARDGTSSPSSRSRKTTSGSTGRGRARRRRPAKQEGREAGAAEAGGRGARRAARRAVFRRGAGRHRAAAATAGPRTSRRRRGTSAAGAAGDAPPSLRRTRSGDSQDRPAREPAYRK